jgi:hypothetical protein
MPKYTIADRTEETDCNNCGWPLYVGDTAYSDEGEQHVFCSRACQQQRHNRGMGRTLSIALMLVLVLCASVSAQQGTRITEDDPHTYSASSKEERGGGTYA